MISTYDLGHQPFGLASPAAWLRREGVDVQCADLSKEKLAEASAAEADLIAAQALLGMGKASAAKERARASLGRYPNGIYARQLREIAEAP